MYRLAIKRRFWFGYEWFTVIGHQTEVLARGTRLVLAFSDGKKMAIPNIDRRLVITYPEHRRYRADEHEAEVMNGAFQPG